MARRITVCAGGEAHSSAAGAAGALGGSGLAGSLQQESLY